jgi:hypothetical protein
MTTNNLPEHIKIFAFYDAPEELRMLSQNGGDEDWIAIIPPRWQVPAFLEEGGSFGCCTVQEAQHWSGCTILIGCHA